MKKPLIIILAFSLLLPFMAYAQTGQELSKPPPVASPIVREGDFALKLVGALGLGTVGSEAEAESILAAADIAPRNGWISDYPVTPDILAEIQGTVGDAADANRLPMARGDSLEALQSVEASFGLAVVPDTSGNYAEAQPPTTPEYTEPSVVDNYYYDEGPPVVTYYPPPWDYNYLYAWVPSPFWWDGFFFPGFFILNDFDRVVIVNGHRCVVTNHVFDHDHHRFFTVDPVGRRRGTGHSWRAVTEEPYKKGYDTGEARREAGSILQHSQERTMPSRGLTRSDSGSSRVHQTPFSHDSHGGRVQIAPRVEAAPGGAERSFSVPDRNEGRSFRSPPMRTEGRSFSPPSMGRRGSSERVRGYSGSFSGGDLEHGRSFGGGHGGRRGRG
jgi:hypothetical protein